MTPKQFIEKAIGGGWNGKQIAASDIRHILLDRLAWQAVGKVEGWETNPQNYTTKLKILGEYKPVWAVNMHRMIDALCEGRSIEQFLETL